MNLRNAAERIRVLNIRFGLLYYLTALKQLPHVCGCQYLTLVRSYLMYGVCERRHQSIICVERHGSNLVCPFAQAFALQQCPYGKRTHVLCSVEQSQTFFRSELYRLPSVLLQHLGSCHHLTLILYVTESYERQTEVCQRHKVAGCAK